MHSAVFKEYAELPSLEGSYKGGESVEPQTLVFRLRCRRIDF